MESGRASPAGLSAEKLLAQVWDENADPFTNTVRVTIGRLRRKLGEPQVIQTTPGIGYRIADSETESGSQSIAWIGDDSGPRHFHFRLLLFDARGHEQCPPPMPARSQTRVSTRA